MSFIVKGIFKKNPDNNSTKKIRISAILQHEIELLSVCMVSNAHIQLNIYQTNTCAISLTLDIFAKLNSAWRQNHVYVHKLKANVLFMVSD